MVFKVIRTTQFESDLDIIHDHLIESYVHLGDAFPDAFDRAEARIKAIETDMEALAQAPHQGTLSPGIMPGLRHVTKNRAVLYFEVDETRETVLVLAVFFGGQDHGQHILDRLRPPT
jgi:plasmid stabilization system protein ParE